MEKFGFPGGAQKLITSEKQ